jgi:hypothetical protein
LTEELLNADFRVRVNPLGLHYAQVVLYGKGLDSGGKQTEKLRWVEAGSRSKPDSRKRDREMKKRLKK